MKKLILIALAIMLVIAVTFSFVACQDNSMDNNSNNNSQGDNNQVDEQKPSDGEENPNGGQEEEVKIVEIVCNVQSLTVDYGTTSSDLLLQLKISAKNNKDELTDVTEQVEFDFDGTVEGQQVVNFTYLDEFTANVVVTVLPKPAQVLNLVVSAETENVFERGTTIEDLTASLHLVLYYDNNETEDVDNSQVTVEGYDPNVKGEQVLTIKYQDYTVTFEIEVVDSSSLVYPSALKVTSKVDILEDLLEETIKNAIDVVLEYSDGTQRQLNNDEYSVDYYFEENYSEPIISVKYVDDSFLSVKFESFEENPNIDLAISRVKKLFENNGVEDYYYDIFDLAEVPSFFYVIPVECEDLLETICGYSSFRASLMDEAAFLENADIETVEVVTKDDANFLSIQLNEEGTRKLAEITSEHVGDAIYFFINYKCVCAPTINSAITDGHILLDLALEYEELNNLATGLQSSVYFDNYAYNWDYYAVEESIKMNAKDKTIVFYSAQGDALQRVTQNAIDEFEAKYPGWKVIHVVPGGYDNIKYEINNSLSNGTQPDVAYCYLDHLADYIQTGKVVDFNDYLYSKQLVSALIPNGDERVSTQVQVGFTDEELADFMSVFFQYGLASNVGNYSKYGYSDNSLLAIPFVLSSEVMYYNKTALDEMMFNPAKTWDELWAQCDELKLLYRESFPFAYDSESNWFATMCYQNGWGYTQANAPHILFNNENTLSWLNSLNSHRGVFRTQRTLGGYTSGLFTAGVKNGCTYSIGSSDSASFYNPYGSFAWGVAPIPCSVVGYDDNGNPIYSEGAVAQGPMLTMFQKNERNLEKEMMTFLFVKELYDVAFQCEFSQKSGYASLRNSVYEQENFKNFLNSNTIQAAAMKIVVEMLREGKLFMAPAFVGSSEVREQVMGVVFHVARGNKTPEKALEDAYKALAVYLEDNE